MYHDTKLSAVFFFICTSVGGSVFELPVDTAQFTIAKMVTRYNACVHQGYNMIGYKLDRCYSIMGGEPEQCTYAYKWIMNDCW